jgi:hypothetical protein
MGEMRSYRCLHCSGINKNRENIPERHCDSRNSWHSSPDLHRTESRLIIELFSIDLFRLFFLSRSLKIIPQKFHLQSDRECFHFRVALVRNAIGNTFDTMNFIRRHFNEFCSDFAMSSYQFYTVSRSELFCFRFTRVKHQTEVAYT